MLLRRKGSKMKKLFLRSAVLALLAAHVAAASAQEGVPRGSAQAGRTFALHNCDACHIVAANQDLRPLSGNYAPSFIDIAKKPSTTADSLRAFLGHPHAYANMPYPDLAAPDLDNVVAYILSLRGKP
jgi:mono/diheme cytochrome c family protein